MNRRGVEMIWVIIWVSLGILLLVGLVFFARNSGIIWTPGSLVPDFNNSVLPNQGEKFVGYNFEDGMAYQFNGANWVLIKDEYLFGNQKISANRISSTFRDFYESPRKGANVIWRDNYRAIVIPFGEGVHIDFVNIIDMPLGPYVSFPLFHFSLNHKDEIGPRHSSIGSIGSQEIFSLYDHSDYVLGDGRKYLPMIIAYRDQILDGMEYEKHVDFLGKNYAVRHVKPSYLAVDLNNPVFRKDLYSNAPLPQNDPNLVRDERLGYVYYDRNNVRAGWESDASVIVDFIDEEGYKDVFWSNSPEGWFVTKTDGIVSSTDSAAGVFRMEGYQHDDFFEGLVLVADKLEGTIDDFDGIFVNLVYGNSRNNREIYRQDGNGQVDTLEKKEKLVESVLFAYNSCFHEPGEETLCEEFDE